jgi:hypothetical protein
LPLPPLPQLTSGTATATTTTTDHHSYRTGIFCNALAIFDADPVAKADQFSTSVHGLSAATNRQMDDAKVSTSGSGQLDSAVIEAAEMVLYQCYASPDSLSGKLAPFVLVRDGALDTTAAAVLLAKLCTIARVAVPLRTTLSTATNQGAAIQLVAALKSYAASTEYAAVAVALDEAGIGHVRQSEFDAVAYVQHAHLFVAALSAIWMHWVLSLPSVLLFLCGSVFCCCCRRCCCSCAVPYCVVFPASCCFCCRFDCRRCPSFPKFYCVAVDHMVARWDVRMVTRWDVHMVAWWNVHMFARWDVHMVARWDVRMVARWNGGVLRHTSHLLMHTSHMLMLQVRWARRRRLGTLF